ESLDRTRYTQAALFALETALYRLVEHSGPTPDHLIGHSVGELVAAHVAGVLSLSDAAALVAARGRLMQAAPDHGVMIAIRASADEVGPDLPAGLVDLAAVNGPSAVVIAGDADAAEEVAAGWRARGRKTRRLQVSHAFHSPHMDGVLDEFRRVAERLAFAPPRIPVVSNLTGEPATADELCSPDYWVRHVRHAVRFHDGIRHLHDRGVTAFVEIGPDATLTAMAADCLPPGGAALLVPTMRRGRPEVRSLLTALGRAHVHGLPVAWSALHPGGRRVELPTYAFQRRRFWLDAPPTSTRTAAEQEFWRAVDHADADGLAAALDVDEHGRGALEELLPVLSAWRQRVDDVPPDTAEDRPDGADGLDDLLRRLAGVPADEQEALLLDLLCAHAATALGHDAPETINPGDSLLELGFTSFTALELSNRLKEATGVLLAPVAVFDHPTPAALARHLRTELTTHS
ncbi:acyltransferase domain-containing protein, partial [Actinosynnema sp. NPDC023658]|uniref:acyltransferase domain-containing protein n=1 Tax=Actinosynnema sp. NPDC023658 TaxID=3155465 RepID=UPI0033E038F6